VTNFDETSRKSQFMKGLISTSKLGKSVIGQEVLTFLH